MEYITVETVLDSTLNLVFFGLCERMLMIIRRVTINLKSSHLTESVYGLFLNLTSIAIWVYRYNISTSLAPMYPLQLNLPHDTKMRLLVVLLSVHIRA